MRRWAQHGCASRISLPSHFKQASVVSSAASCFGTVRIRKYFLRFHTSWTPRSSLSGPIPCPTDIPSRNSIQGTLDSLAKTLNCDRDSLRAYARILEDNWYHDLDTVQQELNAEDAIRMGLPLRIFNALQALPLCAESSVVSHLPEVEPQQPESAYGDQVQVSLPTVRSSAKTFKDPKGAVVTNKAKGSEYSLRDADMTPELQAEMDEWMRFMTKKFYGQREPEIREATAKVYVRIAKLMLGWVKTYREKGGAAAGAGGQKKRVDSAADAYVGSSNNNASGRVDPAEPLRLHHLVPDPTRGSAVVAFDFLQYLREERGCSPSYEANVCRALIKLCKFRFHEDSAAGVNGPEAAYSDVEVIQELRKLHKDAEARRKQGGHVSDESKKWVDWPTFLACVEQLQAECTTLTPKGRPRQPRAIAQAYQRFLVCAVFSCIPDRQRTIRELQIGGTLRREGPKWVIKQKAGDYKTGRHYGDRAPMEIAPQYWPYLDDFVDIYRVHLKPVDGHQFLFCMDNGKPTTQDTIYQIVSRAIFRLTGKKTNPHLLRDSVVTHIRGQDVSEKKLEALALFMGHSLATQKSSYDRRTLEEKIAPATELIQSIKPRSLDAQHQVENES